MTSVYSHREKGRLAEVAVCHRFRALGFSVLSVNYFVPSVGELDLVLNRGSFLYFVEVKSVFAPDGRSSVNLTNPLLQISPVKQRRIRLTAAAYIRHHQMVRYWPAFWAVGCRMSSDGKLTAWQVVPMT